MSTHVRGIAASLVIPLLLACCRGAEPPEALVSATELSVQTSTPSPATNTPYPTSTNEPPTPSPTYTQAPPTDMSIPTINPDNTATVMDIDGNIYNTVKIGDQWWMAESLKVASDPDGSTLLSYCYDHDELNCETYGRFYSWDVAMNGSTTQGDQGICPDGWHIPSDTEWSIMFEYLGGVNVAGGKMKFIGTTHWKEPNLGATNISGFNGLPAGSYNLQGDYFEGIGIGVHFWSSTEDGSKAGLPTLHYKYESVLLLSEPKRIVASIRCLMD